MRLLDYILATTGKRVAVIVENVACIFEEKNGNGTIIRFSGGDVSGDLWVTEDCDNVRMQMR